jgi:hypothetical protein
VRPPRYRSGRKLLIAPDGLTHRLALIRVGETGVDALPECLCEHDAFGKWKRHRLAGELLSGHGGNVEIQAASVNGRHAREKNDGRNGESSCPRFHARRPAAIKRGERSSLASRSFERKCLGLGDCISELVLESATTHFELGEVRYGENDSAVIVEHSRLLDWGDVAEESDEMDEREAKEDRGKGRNEAWHGRELHDKRRSERIKEALCMELSR